MWVRRKKHRYLHYSISKCLRSLMVKVRDVTVTGLDYVIRSLSKVPERNCRG